MRRLWSEAAAYALVSLIALGADFTTLRLLVELAGFHYLLAATCSFIAGAVVAYLLSVRLVFRYRRLADRRLEFMVFACIGLVGLIVNIITMYVLVSVHGVSYMIAKGAAACLTFGTNFLLRRWMLFSGRPGSTSQNQVLIKEVS
jgi:putative flippase GtrA